MKRIAIVLGLLLGACGGEDGAGTTGCMDIDQEIHEACDDDADFGECRAQYLDDFYPSGTQGERWTPEADAAWWMQFHCESVDLGGCAAATAMCESLS